MNNERMTDSVNSQIEYFKDKWWFNPDNVSDWYHTFWELYKHRIHLFIALCKTVMANRQIIEITKDYAPAPWWQKFLKQNLLDSLRKYKLCISKKHYDWIEYEWWFIVQLETPFWQISYHLPNEYWVYFNNNWCKQFIKERANKWDKHTSDDVLERLLLI